MKHPRMFTFGMQLYKALIRPSVKINAKRQSYWLRLTPANHSEQLKDFHVV
jgi:hypothetical protein